MKTNEYIIEVFRGKERTLRKFRKSSDALARNDALCYINDVPDVTKVCCYNIERNEQPGEIWVLILKAINPE